MITNGSAMARYGLILCEDGDLGSRSLDLPLQDQLDSRFERKMESILGGKLGSMVLGAKGVAVRAMDARIPGFRTEF